MEKKKKIAYRGKIMGMRCLATPSIYISSSTLLNSAIVEVVFFDVNGMSISSDDIYVYFFFSAVETIENRLATARGKPTTIDFFFKICTPCPAIGTPESVRLRTKFTCTHGSKEARR